MTKKALEDIRILDLGVIWAVPHSGMLMANMGAEVIKIEAIQRMDATRGPIAPDPSRGVLLGLPGGVPGERPWNQGPYYHSTNTSKLSLTLDLSRPRGIEIFKELAKKSDIVLEGFAGGVMERMGLGYEVLKEVNPELIVVSAPGFGAGGPWSQYRCFGTVVWHVSAMSMLSGYPGGGPMQAGNTFPDPTVGCHIAGCVMAALIYRRRTGKGQFLDVAQVESTIGLTGPYLMDFIMNGRGPERVGNRHPVHAPHGCYPCEGEDNWVTIAVTTDQEWKALCSVMGNPELAEDQRFVDALNRRKNQDELDGIIMEWTVFQDQYDVMDSLQKAGLAAGAVLRVEQVHDNPQLKARGFYEEVDHPDTGTHLYRNVGYRMSKTPGHVLRHPPYLGEHNEYVLGTILGMSGEEIEALEADQLVGKVPLPGADGN
jgi:crotonobetainyl-CoA:carnitine CoA-transferase CaiB-like acyl-CoA transferase